MREMTMLDTGFLAGLLLLSLVLPLMLTRSGPPQFASRRSCMKIVWLGQALLGIAGVVVLVSSAGALMAAAVGALSSAVCAGVLCRQLRLASAGKSAH